MIAERAAGIQRGVMRDQIIISQLGVSAFIGAFEEERKRPQRLRVSLVLEPVRDFKSLGDALENTVDYDAVTRAVKSLAGERQRLLVETLAEDIAALLLASYPLAAVEVEVRKYILPDTEFVAVRVRREA